MKLQVLVATMHQTDFSKLEEMNICTDVIFANQSNTTEYAEEVFNGVSAKMITTETIGVGVNRNIAMSNATGDIVLFADDDLVYVDNYHEIVLEAFKKVPKADAIIFNIETIGAKVARRQNDRIKRVRFCNALNYGAPRIAVRRESITKANLSFNTNFGGGTQYSAGEDTLFICSMLKAGLKIYTYPETIAAVDQSSSTWFKGYTPKYFYDKGALYKAVSKTFAWPLCLQDAVRHKGRYSESGLSLGEMLSYMRKGREGYGLLRPYSENQ